LLPASAVYADNDANGARANVRDGLWSTQWRTTEVAATASAPHYIAYDLSSIAGASRGRVLSAWMNQQYDYDTTGASAFTLIGDYQIQANAAAGGSFPGSGWVTLTSVSGNKKGAGMHVLDLTGYNWVRILVTAGASNDAAGNIGTSLKEWQLFDASLGVNDTWFFVGDSITSNAFGNNDADGIDVLMNARTGIVPGWYKGSHGGYKTDDLRWESPSDDRQDPRGREGAGHPEDHLLAVLRRWRQHPGLQPEGRADLGRLRFTHREGPGPVPALL